MRRILRLSGSEVDCLIALDFDIIWIVSMVFPPRKSTSNSQKSGCSGSRSMQVYGTLSENRFLLPSHLQIDSLLGRERDLHIFIGAPCSGLSVREQNSSSAPR